MENTNKTKKITYWDFDKRCDVTKEMIFIGKRKMLGNKHWKNIYHDESENKYYAKSYGDYKEVYLNAKRSNFSENPNGEIWIENRYETLSIYAGRIVTKYEYVHDLVFDTYSFNNNKFKDYNSLKLYMDAYSDKFGHLKRSLDDYARALRHLNKIKRDFDFYLGMFSNTSSAISMKVSLDEQIEDCEYCIEQIKEMLK